MRHQFVNVVAVIFAVILLLLALPVMAFAQPAAAPLALSSGFIILQDPSPAPPVVGDDPAVPPSAPLIDIEAVVTRLLNFIREQIEDGLTTAKLWPVVTVLVGVIKYIPPVKKRIAEGRFSVPLLVFIVGTITWLGAALAGWFGYSAQFLSAADWLSQTLPNTLQLVALLFGASWLHEWASERNIPVLGMKVTPDTPLLPEAVVGYGEAGDSLSDWQHAFDEWRAEQSRSPAGGVVTHSELQAMLPNMVTDIADQVVQRLQTALG